MRSNAAQKLGVTTPSHYMQDGNLRCKDWKYNEGSRSVSDLRVDDIILEAYELTSEASQEDWDGYGAEPVKPSHLAHVFSMLSRLPSKYEIPKLIPEPGGEIGMEWRSENASIILSYVGNEEVTYSLIKKGFSSYGSLKEDAFGDFLQMLDLIYE